MIMMKKQASLSVTSLVFVENRQAVARSLPGH